jgi:hypothetical protein
MEQTEREALDAAETYLRPPDEPYPHRAYAEARECLRDAVAYLDDPDPEAALASAREAIARIEAAL